MNIDPLTELMPDQSPYNYAFNNPIFWIDPDGRMPEEGDAGGGSVGGFELNGGDPPTEFSPDELGETDVLPNIVVETPKKEEQPKPDNQSESENINTVKTDGIKVWGAGGKGTDVKAGGGIVTGNDRGSGSITVDGNDVNALYTLLNTIVNYFISGNDDREPKNDSAKKRNNKEPVSPPEETKTIKLTKVTPHFRRWNNETIDQVTTSYYDTIVKKTISTDSLIKSKNTINKSKIDKAINEYNERF